jgi:hypothetical protein
MPTEEAPIDVNEPQGPDATNPQTAGPNQPVPPANGKPQESAPPIHSQSRWIDYDTHELLSMINELEDERRWARLREGILWAILLHGLLILTLAMLPRYIFAPRIIEPHVSALEKPNDWTYLDTPRDAIKPKQQKQLTNPVPEKPATIDRKTLEELQKAAPPAPEPAPKPQEQASAPTPPPIPPNPQSQSQLEAPRPAAVPARPNFAMGSQNPNEQLRDAMKGASRNPGMGDGQLPGRGGLSMHPGAGTGGIQVLSDTQGVDFNGWLQRWHRETERTWDPLIPDEVNPPILKAGMVAVRFKVLPNGRIMDGSMFLDGRSGDVALDRAAWGALTGSNYPPLPRDFHGPYLELRAYFMYNMEPPR